MAWAANKNGAMKYLIGLLFVGTFCFGQLTVDNSLTPQQLVEDVLLGDGINLVSVTYTGNSSQIAQFTANTQNMTFPEGVILSTGNASDASGPNNSGTTGNDLSGGGYQDLTTLGGNDTYDAAILEFRFVPSTNKVSFEYVFASDEYPEFVCSTVNDAFGFFLSGPGIAGPFQDGAVNLAIIPGTNTPVSINTVNPGTSSGGGGSPCDLGNAAYYISNGDGSESPYNSSNEYIEYDGMTVTLTAEHDVIPCQLYTIRMVIADGGDGVYDSGVFLKQGSFSAGNLLAGIELDTPNGYASEGCDQASLVLNFPDSLANDTSITVEFIGTATNGVDFTYIDPVLNFSAGDTTYTINIFPELDGVPEGPEEIVIVVPTSACSYDTVRLEIRDYEPISIQAFSDTTVCVGAPVDVNAIATGGGGVYQYEWFVNNFSQAFGDSVQIIPDTSIYAVVQVEDECIVPPVRDSVLISVFPIPHADFDQALYPGCAPFEATLTNTSSVSSGALTYQWVINLDTLLDETPTYMVLDTGFQHVQLVVTSGLSCTDTLVNDTFLLGVAQPEAGFFVPDTLSEFQSEVNITQSAVDADSCKYYILEMATGIVDSIFQCDYEYDFDELGEYQITQIVFNSLGCSDTIQGTVRVFPELTIYFPNAFNPSSESSNNFFMPKGEGFEQFEMIIFNRWGELVFETKSIHTGWNGSINNLGEQLPIGVYGYKYSVTDYVGNIYEGMGHVTLVR